MTDADDPSESYEVGFGRPPKNTQFQKGDSGNPLGRRPQGAPSNSSEADELTTTYDIGFKQPPRSTKFRKGVSGNPYGRKAERHFVESILSKVLFSATAPTAATRSRACTNLEAMVRAMWGGAGHLGVSAADKAVLGRKVIAWLKSLVT
ncbi:DUF5681 domain-containing protein [Geothrix alkalitolerans]|uniref:DUF5681 domain-containing protein n=1 Tax=Geothrix alkalitolerans TaxID=2922724 RepID=UPI001FAFB081|nr:DUF5681 domain-containing protein [Geothrix alkalitolerans]